MRKTAIGNFHWSLCKVSVEVHFSKGKKYNPIWQIGHFFSWPLILRELVTSLTLCFVSQTHPLAVVRREPATALGHKATAATAVAHGIAVTALSVDGLALVGREIWPHVLGGAVEASVAHGGHG